jgi:hypothetical protein
MPFIEQDDEFGEFQSGPTGQDENFANFELNSFREKHKKEFDDLESGNKYSVDSAKKEIQKLLMEDKKAAHEALRLEIGKGVLEKARKSGSMENIKKDLKDRARHYFVPRIFEDHFTDIAHNAQNKAEESLAQHQEIDDRFKQMELDIFGPQISDKHELDELTDNLQSIFEQYAKAADQAPQAFVDNLYQAIGDDKGGNNPKKLRSKIDAAFYNAKRESQQLLSTIQGIYSAEIEGEIAKLHHIIQELEKDVVPELQEKCIIHQVLEQQWKAQIEQLEELKPQGWEKKITEAKDKLHLSQKILEMPEMQKYKRLEQAKIMHSKACDMAGYITQVTQEKLDIQTFAYDEQYKKITTEDLKQNGLFYKIAEKISGIGTGVVKICEPISWCGGETAAHVVGAKTFAAHAGVVGKTAAGAVGKVGIVGAAHTAAGIGAKILTYAWGAMIVSGVAHVTWSKSAAKALKNDLEESQPLLRISEKHSEVDSALSVGFTKADLAKMDSQELSALMAAETELNVKMGYVGRAGDIIIGSGFKGLFSKIGSGVKTTGKVGVKMVRTVTPDEMEVLVVGAVKNRIIDPVKDKVKEAKLKTKKLATETHVFKTDILEQKHKIAEKLYASDPVNDLELKRKWSMISFMPKEWRITRFMSKVAERYHSK